MDQPPDDEDDRDEREATSSADEVDDIDPGWSGVPRPLGSHAYAGSTPQPDIAALPASALVRTAAEFATLPPAQRETARRLFEEAPLEKWAQLDAGQRRAVVDGLMWASTVALDVAREAVARCHWVVRALDAVEARDDAALAGILFAGLHAGGRTARDAVALVGELRDATPLRSAVLAELLSPPESPVPLAGALRRFTLRDDEIAALEVALEHPRSPAHESALLDALQVVPPHRLSAALRARLHLRDSASRCLRFRDDNTWARALEAHGREALAGEILPRLEADLRGGDEAWISGALDYARRHDLVPPRWVPLLIDLLDAKHLPAVRTVAAEMLGALGAAAAPAVEALQKLAWSHDGRKRYRFMGKAAEAALAKIRDAKR